MSLKDRFKLGATGNFPHGHFDKHDQGELRIAVGRIGNVIRIDFGKPVAWLGLEPKHARELAKSLLKYADRDNESGRA